MAIAANESMLVGDSDGWSGTVTDDAGNPIDLTGLTVVFSLALPSGRLQKTLTQPGGVGAVALPPLSRTDTSGAAAGGYPYDVVLVDGSGNHRTCRYGTMTLIAHANP